MIILVRKSRKILRKVKPTRHEDRMADTAETLKTKRSDDALLVDVSIVGVASSPYIYMLFLNFN